MKALSSLEKRKAAKMMYLQLKRTVQNLLYQIRQNVSQNNPWALDGNIVKEPAGGKMWESTHRQIHRCTKGESEK